MTSSLWIVSAGLLVGLMPFHPFENASNRSLNEPLQSHPLASSQPSNESDLSDGYFRDTAIDGRPFRMIYPTDLTAHRGSGRNCSTEPCG
jgi:hypothetical protein